MHVVQQGAGLGRGKVIEAQCGELRNIRVLLHPHPRLSFASAQLRDVRDQRWPAFGSAAGSYLAAAQMHCVSLRSIR